MRHLFYAAALSVVLAAPLAAQDGAEQAIEGVIQSQIDAFLQDDFTTAFTFASPGIQRMFGTPENFGAMVRNGYPMVHRPAEVKFLDLSEAGGAMRQKVMIRDQAGRYFMLEYEMVPTPDGWQIAGVRFLEMPQVGA